jgi:hypothetical protein
MSEIRMAMFRDIPVLVRFFRDALDRSRYSGFGDIDEAQAKSVLIDCLSTQAPSPGRCIVLVAEEQGQIVGVFVGVCSRLYEALPVNVAANLIWCVSPEASGRSGLLLLKAFEDWARRAEGKTILRVGLSDTIDDPETLRPLMQRKGFCCSGLTYDKEL